MSNRIPKNRSTKIGLWGGLSLVILFLIVVTGEAAYNTARPITTTGGRILQSYLWAMETIINTNVALHKGVDFSYATGTNVYAVASGEVVDLEQTIQNGDRTSTWGNYVLIRHDQRHYDRTASQWAYVYSMYIHLSQFSVQSNLGDHVNRGDLIALSDDTGAGSSGPHLHLQIVVHPLPDRVLVPNNLDSENRSRNPELWLSPYTYDENTARAVGKVTDLLGNPVSNLKICGMQKPYGNYAWSRTYSYPWANPDDILVENFATTDVSPGTYHLYAQNEDDDCDHQPPYRDLGMHTFVAGKTTYIGLHPVWLPYVRGSGRDFISTIHIRNNSSTYRAQINTTYFYNSGNVRTQRTDFVNSNASIALTPPNNFVGSALIVSSQDIAVAVLSEHNPPFSTSAYAGVTEPETNLFVPLVHRNNGGWNSLLSLHNAGLEKAMIQAEFIPGSVGSSCTQSQYVEPNATWTLNTSGIPCLGYAFIGSVRVTSASPIATAVTGRAK